MPERLNPPELVRRNFRIDLVGGICAGIYVSVLVAFMPVVVRRMGGSTLEVALVVAAPFIGHLLSPVFAYILTSYRPVPVVAASATLSRSIFVAGVLVATSPLMLALTTVAFWIVTIASIAAYTTVMASIYPADTRAQAMARVRVGASVAGIASAVVAGAFIDALPAGWVFAASALISLPGALAFFAIRDDAPAQVPARRPALAIARDIWRDRRYRSALAAFSVFGAGNLMNAAVFPIMLVDHFDAPNTFVGILAAVQSVVAIGAFLYWGRLIDRGSSLRLSLYNALLMLLVPIGYLVAPTVWALLGVAVVFGIAIAAGDLTYHTNVVQLAPPGRVTEYAAAQSFLLGVRGTAAPFVASALMGAVEPRAVLVVGLALMVVGARLLSRVAREPAASALAPVAVAS